MSTHQVVVGLDVGGTSTNATVLDATGRHRGLLTGGDLAAWRATVEPAVSGEFHGSTVYKPGPWSQGLSPER